MKDDERERLLSGWRRAVKAAIIAAPDRAQDTGGARKPQRT
jgi:glycerol kinase